MNNLPNEILNQIFILLHQQDKVECLKTSRHFNKAINNFSLFQTVRVTNKKQLDTLFKRRTLPELFPGTKVNRLLLDLSLESDFDMNRLFSAFPHVTNFITFNVHGSYPIATTTTTITTTSNRLYQWNKQIESIEEYLSSIHTRQLLTFSPCPRLEKITVIGEEMQPGKDVIHLLENAPALRTLTLGNFSFTLADLELLHKNAPLLRSLTLQHIKISCVTTFLLSNTIQPAISMTSLIIERASNSVHKGKMAFSQYISKKYTNLSELVYDVRDMYEVNDDDMYKYSFVPLMERLGYQLKLLSFGWGENQFNTFDMLDATNCKIKKLAVEGESALEQLASSAQIKHIHTLTLSGYLNFTTTLECLKGFKLLTELHLSGLGLRKRRLMDLGTIFEVLGDTLEIFKLHDCEFIINTVTTTMTNNNHTNTTHNQYPRLKNLSFNRVSLPPQLDTFISMAFPALRTLKFERCQMKGSVFTLSNIDLFCFEIIDQFLNDNSLMIQTLIDNKKHIYTTYTIAYNSYSRLKINHLDSPLFPTVKSLPCVESNQASLSLPFMTLVCHSIINVIMINTLD